MEGVCKGVKWKWASQDGVDVCRPEPERDEKKWSEGNRGGVELIMALGRRKDVQDNAPRAKFVDAHRSNVFSSKIHNNKRQIQIFFSSFQGISFKLPCQIQRSAHKNKQNFPRISLPCRMLSLETGSCTSGAVFLLPLLARRPTQQGYKCLLHWEYKCQKQILTPLNLTYWICGYSEM